MGAGLGTRLRPLTDTVPKVMVPIAPGKPLLEHTIELLRNQGITDFIINLHYLPDVITAHFGNGSRFGVGIRYSDETQYLSETGGALKKAESLLDDDFIFTYGDELYFMDIAPLVDMHLRKNAAATIALKTSDSPANGDIGEFDPISGRMVKWHPRPHEISKFARHRMLNAGFYALSKQVLDFIPVGKPVKFDGEIIPNMLITGEAIYAFPAEEPIMDVGTPEKYEFAKEYYSNRKKSNIRPEKDPFYFS